MKTLIAAVAAAALASSIGCGRSVTPVQAAGNDTKTPGVVTLPPESPMLRQIARAPVRVIDLPTDELTAPGKIEAKPGRVAKVLLPVTGRIVSVFVKTGDTVAREQPLLTLQSPDADAAISAYLSAQAGVAQAEAAEGKARADLARENDLFEHDAIAQKEVLTARSVAAQAAAALEQARAAREQARRRLAVLGLGAEFDQLTTVRAPLAGKVLEIAAAPGEFRNDASTSVMTIADLSSVWVTSQVPESYIRFVQMGEEVEISLVAYPGERFAGHVSRIADTVDPQTRTVKVQAEIANREGRLRPEMYGTIHHVEATAPTVVVPFAAVVQDENAALVFVESSPGRFEPRPVTLGKRAGADVRVVDGLTPGQTVAVDGVMLLEGLLKSS